jgi:hypothetical protein
MRNKPTGGYEEDVEKLRESIATARSSRSAFPAVMVAAQATTAHHDDLIINYNIGHKRQFRERRDCLKR